jgi:type IX secretion system PorP/SprF family membrane protein
MWTKWKFSMVGALLIWSLNGTAQQDPQYSNYMLNMMPYNPAYAGSEYYLQAQAIFRNQWQGLEGAPRTMVLNLDMDIEPIRGGAGASFVYNRIGVEETISGMLAYAYNLKLKGNSNLRFGIAAGLMSKRYDPQSLTGPNPANPTGDPSVPSAGGNTHPNINLGVLYKSKTVTLGLSTTNLFEPEFTNLSYRVARHYYAVAGYKYQLPINAPVWVQPTVLAKTDGASTQLDMNLIVTRSDNFWLGAGYRMNDAIILMGGVFLGNIRLGYSYDRTTSSDLVNYTFGTHEVFLSWSLNKEESEAE